MSCLKGKKCLVVGGAGNLGSTIVRCLVAEGAIVTSLDLLPYTCSNNGAAEAADNDNLPDDTNTTRVTSVVGDIQSLETVTKAVQGNQVVIHTASVIDIRPVPDETMTSVNIQGTRNIVQACQDCDGVDVLVYTSSIEVVAGYDARGQHQLVEGCNESSVPIAARHYMPYSSSKAAAEQIIFQAAHQDAGRKLKVCVLRPGYIVGEGSIALSIELQRTLKTADYYVTSRLPTVMTCTCVKNCALAHVVAASKCLNKDPLVMNQTFYVGDFDANLVDLNIHGMTDTPVEPWLLPIQLAAAIALVMNWYDRFLHWLARVTGLWTRHTPREFIDYNALKIAYKNLTVSSAKARHALGYGVQMSNDNNGERRSSWQTKEECLREMKDWGRHYYYTSVAPERSAETKKSK